MTNERFLLVRRIRFWLALFVFCLVVSGLTAFPLESELTWLANRCDVDTTRAAEEYTGLQYWLAHVVQGLRETNERFPFIAYGTDWLAFGHLVIALFFVGPWIDPVKNEWVVTAGLIACAGVIPLALIAGEVRGIPLEWRAFDCSFGVLGSVPLWICRRNIQRLADIQAETP